MTDALSSPLAQQDSLDEPAPLTQIPMTTSLDPGTCPCGRSATEDGFCDEHAGAVAFKVPMGPDGELLPAVWWHWPHDQPCPYGEAWRIRLPSGPGDDGETTWACRHRTHDVPQGLRPAGSSRPLEHA